jgi:hypothetical protein
MYESDGITYHALDFNIVQIFSSLRTLNMGKIVFVLFGRLRATRGNLSDCNRSNPNGRGRLRPLLLFLLVALPMLLLVSKMRKACSFTRW